VSLSFYEAMMERTDTVLTFMKSRWMRCSSPLLRDFSLEWATCNSA
jgi:hypothetical protein